MGWELRAFRPKEERPETRTVGLGLRRMRQGFAFVEANSFPSEATGGHRSARSMELFHFERVVLRSGKGLRDHTEVPVGRVGIVGPDILGRRRLHRIGT